MSYIANAFKWLLYPFEYLYHSLIPQTISGKNVKNKAKLTKIYGNGVVENQLDFNGDFHTNDSSYYSATEPNYMSMSIANNVLTCSIIQTISSGTTGNLKIDMAYKGHKYLFATLVKSTIGNNTIRIGFSINGADEYGDFLVNQGETKLLSGIYETKTSASTQTAIIRFQGGHSAGNTFESYYYEIIDLTLMFGTGNEPTTLTDNRIQALLNRGYIAYNTGSYKNSRVSEIECKPYNLFDGTLENGQIIGSSGAVISNNYMLISDYIKVLPNKNYTIERNNLSSTRSYIFYFDKDKNIINWTASSNSPWSIDTLSNCFFIRLQFYNNDNIMPVPLSNDVCFHLTGTRTGYAPYQAPTKITLPGLMELNGAINSHDTFEITNTDYVFTKNIGVVDLGTQKWATASYGFYITLNDTAVGDLNVVENIVCPKYPTDKSSNTNIGGVDKTIALDQNHHIQVRDSAYSTAVDFKTAMSGVMLYYELATPQVITIPKKHLGCVDLGSLNWNRSTWEGVNFFYAVLSNSSGQSNMYCSPYPISNNKYVGGMSDKSTFITDRLYVRDDSITSATDFKSAMAGQYLFYETEEEVSDFDNVAQINAGGSITSNLFSWVRNQLANAIVQSQTINGIVFTNNNDGSYTANGTATANTTKTVSSVFQIISGHYYLICGGASGGSSSTYRLLEGYSYRWFDNDGTGYIQVANSSGSASLIIEVKSGITCNNLIFRPQFIDLTLAFGVGKEPTDVNDPRIQYIINNGYIPTDTVGTEESIAPEALPNVEMKVQVK